jgi:hypothetical protein
MAKTKKNPSARKKLLSAIAMLTVSAVTLSTATYAWFTMNKEVTVQGMQLKTKVSGNLLISETNASDATYGQFLVQGRSGLLEPVSTATGANGSFYYTVDAKADGSKLHAASNPYQYKLYNEGSGATDTTYSKKTYYDSTFNSTYGITPSGSQFGTAYGYMDYDFYLKATGDGTNSDIVLKTCDLSYNNAAIASGTTTDIDKAWRIAVFAVETSAETTGVSALASGATNRVGNIMSLANAEYFASGAVVGTGDNYQTVTLNGNDGQVIGSVGLGETKYYKVTVRIWLEGQDTSCKSETYADLTNNAWQLNMEFSLDADEDYVDGIGTAAYTSGTNDVPDAFTDNQQEAGN